jgi:ferritin-like metal-binding protein YciE
MQADQVEYLFLHELSDLYDAEQQLADLLPQLVDEMPGGPVKVAFQEHNRETNEQIVNLERIFDLLGEEPQEVTCLAIEGLVEAREDFKLNASPTLQMLYDVSASNKIENFEITAYRGLIEKANLLGRTDVVELLEANLRQEEEMAGKVLGLGRQLMGAAMEGQSLT